MGVEYGDLPLQFGRFPVVVGVEVSDPISTGRGGSAVACGCDATVRLADKGYLVPVRSEGEGQFFGVKASVVNDEDFDRRMRLAADAVDSSADS
jgi:hypothetical protein